MKALLLSAGMGTRLGNITSNTPKCMVKVGGKAMLERWLEKLEEINCEEVLINTHYLSEKVIKGTSEWREGKGNVSIVHEEVLLGTAKTLIANKQFFTNEVGLIIHTDNYMEEPLKKLIQAHKERASGCIMTVLISNQRNQSCGIMKTDSDGRMIEYIEKPMEPPGNLANGAVFVFEQELFRHRKILL